MKQHFWTLAADTSFAPAAPHIKDDDIWAMAAVGIALTLWLVAGLVCVGRQRTYRLGIWMLGSGAAAGVLAGLLWS